MTEQIRKKLTENRLFTPPADFVATAHISDAKQYEQMYQQSIQNPNLFWGEIAETFIWHKKWDCVCDLDNLPFAQWFKGAKLNITENCIDRHLKTARKNKAALIWEGEKGDRAMITYLELYRRVCRFANVLKQMGVTKGDRVIIYLPMIPELAISLLACARIGAIHSVVFAGFSAGALQDRIQDSQAKLIVTADGGFRRGTVIKLKSVIDAALENTACVKRCIVVKYAGCEHNMQVNRDVYWEVVSKGVSETCEVQVMDAEDPLFILYTSGSTGKPKGIVHSSAGYMVGTATSSKYIFDLKEADTYWCTADIGWITGHSYLVYGPLLNGVSSLMYEGAPNWPHPNRFWEIIERYQVNIFYTAPTLIRAAMKWGEKWVTQHDLSSLRLLGSVGEPINPAAWLWYYEKIGHKKCPIVDTWWQTETGSIMLSPIPGVTALKPGSATIPFLGVDAAVVNEQGEVAKEGEDGFLVIKQPWPSMLTNIWGDSQRFVQVYWQPFKAQGYYLTGDYAVCGKHGYFTILGRIDDAINVSGHLFSTMELESVLIEQGEVVESAVVGYPHELKGEGIAAFIILASGQVPNEALKAAIIQQVAQRIGAIAKPDQVHFVETLPKTRSGKIMRRLLRDIAAGREVTGDISTLEDEAALKKMMGKTGV